MLLETATILFFCILVVVLESLMKIVDYADLISKRVCFLSNKRITEDVDIKLGKSQEMSVGCGTKTIAIGDCARDEVPMDTTIMLVFSF